MTAPAAFLRTPPARWVWLVWLAVLVMVLVTLLSIARYPVAEVGPRWGLRGATVIPALVSSTIAGLILARHPGHRVGLLMLWVGVGSTLQVSLEEYAIYGLLTAPGSVPGAMLVAWVCNWIWIPVNGMVAALLPLYFPSGRLPSPRWRPVVGLALLSLAAMSLSQGLMPGPFQSAFGRYSNPYALQAFGADSAAVVNAAFWGSTLLTFGLITLAALSMLYRLRRARGAERQQLKWFVYAVVVAAVLTPLAATDEPALHLIYLVALTSLPISIGIAVLRYRLYDIDLLVNRALVYGVLTAILAAAYFSCVVALQSVLVTLTGERQSALVTVLSTLAIAALFTPVRARVQTFIDRRFYRRKYDAGQTLAAFSVTIRDDVDLAVLRERLLQVVDDTIQPAEAALWLKQQPD